MHTKGQSRHGERMWLITLMWRVEQGSGPCFCWHLVLFWTVAVVHMGTNKLHVVIFLKKLSTCPHFMFKYQYSNCSFSLSHFSEGKMDKVKWILTWPLIILLFFTIPNCSKPRWENFFMLTFLLSTLWIAVFSYFMVWLVSAKTLFNMKIYFEIQFRIQVPVRNNSTYQHRR